MGYFGETGGAGEEAAGDVVDPKSVDAGMSSQVCVDVGDEPLLVGRAPDVEENRGCALVVNRIAARVLEDPVVRDSGAIRDAASRAPGVGGLRIRAARVHQRASGQERPRRWRYSRLRARRCTCQCSTACPSSRRPTG